MHLQSDVQVGILMKKRVSQGFFMVELTIAILIMTITAFVCMGYYTKTLIIQKDTELYLHATTLASGALEKVISERKMPSYTQRKEGLFTIDWHTQLKDKFMFIDVVVRWQSTLKTSRSITLRSGFVPDVGVFT